EKVQIVAAKTLPLYTLERMKEYDVIASEKVQLTAINTLAVAIRHIHNPSEEMQLVAVRNNGRALKFIKNPSKEVQLAALRVR
ncbi:unnamed protein product, partial [marine sediment metagenome]